MKIVTKIVALFLLAIFASPVSAAYEISDGSVKALLHLDGNLNDSSGNGNNFTIAAGSTATYNTGLLGQGLVTNGVLPRNSNDEGIYNNSMSSPSYADWANKGFTYFETFKLSTSSDDHFELMEVRVTNGTSMRQFFIVVRQNGSLVLQAFPKTSSSYFGTADPSSINVSLNTWHQTAFTYSPTTSKATLYFDGSNVWEDTITWEGYTLNNSYLRLYGFNGWPGMADESFIADKALSASDISALWASGVGTEICTTAGCGSTATSTATSTASTATSSIFHSAYNQIFRDDLETCVLATSTYCLQWQKSSAYTLNFLDVLVYVLIFAIPFIAIRLFRKK